MLVTVPAVLLLLDYWPLRRMRFSPGLEVEPTHPQGEAFAARSLGWLLLEKVPLAALSAIASLWTYVLQKEGGAMQFLSRLTLKQRAGNAVVSVPRYLWKTLRPIDLSVYYPHPGNWPGWAVASSALLIVLLSALTLWQARLRPWLAVGWFWFLGMLIPVSGIIQVGSQSMADRYTYLPGVGLVIALVWSVSELAQRVPKVRPMLKPAVAGVTAILSVATVLQQRYWDNTTDLFEHALVVDERNWLAHLFAGTYYQANGDHPAALKEFDRSLELEPAAYETYQKLGISLMALDRVDELIDRCRKALELDPNLTTARLWLGIALGQKGELDEAARQLAEVARRTPGDANAHAEYGNVLVKMHRYNEARPELEAALKIKPGHELALQALAEMNRGGIPTTLTAPATASQPAGPPPR
jgi:Tfp pilus assembly protein PilF